jgi:hypothetical protein
VDWESPALALAVMDAFSLFQKSQYMLSTTKEGNDLCEEVEGVVMHYPCSTPSIHL